VNLQGGSFPKTRHSVVLLAQSDDLDTRSRAIDEIAATYWRPVYKYIRVKWNTSVEDAADFTQDFFARLLEKQFLDSYDRSKGMLRTYLRTCADRLFMNQIRDSNRQKRGEGMVHFSLDIEETEQELAAMPPSESPEDCFDKEWVRSLFTLGLRRLRVSCESSGKMVHYELLARYDLEECDPRPTYAQLAAEFSLSPNDVTNYLAFARRELRRCVLDQLRDMTASDEEFRSEARAMLGVEIK
jgi:RNA polymerase sigma factor (sigma-70 family)